MMVDLDSFKPTNDAFGHQVGDEAFIAVARTLHGAVRAEDLVARYGGEEFVLAGLCREESESLCLAARVMEAIRNLRIELPDQVLRLTTSLGLARAVEPALVGPAGRPQGIRSGEGRRA
jgi:diguanylate cyclase (GGDEF)-like protein